MKISVSWLNEWINEVPKNLAAHLTMLGLEVEAESLAAPEFTQVVVGEVLEVNPHPDADKLRVATVDVGAGSLLQIVCGAPNVAKGIKVPTAVIGAVLPGDFKITQSKLRGVDSFGMLCSARELGLNEDHEGLMILDSSSKVGEDFRTLYQLDDAILEVDLTPNRGDCLSIVGIARDLALSTGVPLFERPQLAQPLQIDATKKITVHNTKACPRYLGRMITGLNLEAQTPLWMRERLRRCGIRPHGLLVDITNYVLIELGQPLHAFDAQKIQGAITVRNATPGETLTLLNDNTVTLTDDILVISDDSSVLAMAGIMGGKSSACDGATTDIFLESAWFSPLALAGKARAYGLHTDASHRFERGVDFALAQNALEYATELLITLGQGQAGPICGSETLEHLPIRKEITLRFDRVNAILGKTFTKETIGTILGRVGVIVEETDSYIKVKVPSYRFDIEIEEDLIEEIARIDGYDNIPVNKTRAMLTMGHALESQIPLHRFKTTLVDRDYMEVITMSFVKPEWQKILDPEHAAIMLQNPISADLSVMRTQLIAGLIGAMEYNLKRQQKRVRIFESGLTFKGHINNIIQQPFIGGAICGDITPEEWGESARKVDFFDIKGDVEALLNLAGPKQRFTFVATPLPMLHPGQSAQIINPHGAVIGYLGKLHPTIAKQLDCYSEIYIFELLLSAIETAKVPSFKELSKFPTSRRDLALVVPNALSVNDVITRIVDKRYNLLYSVKLFDIYHGTSDGVSIKSMAFSLIFQDEKENLKDEQIDTIIENILNDLRLSGIYLRQ